jgi:hypothetical protein
MWKGEKYQQQHPKKKGINKFERKSRESEPDGIAFIIVCRPPRTYIKE